MLIKCLAREIPPECTRSPLAMWMDAEMPQTYPDITLIPNRHYSGYKAPLYEIAEQIDQAAHYYNTAKEIRERVRIIDALNLYDIRKTNGKRWTPRELSYIRYLFEQYDRNPYDGRDAEQRLLCTLDLITGRPWSSKPLHGSVQGEYITAVYPADTSSDLLHQLETDFFNMGKEFDVYINADPDNLEDTDEEPYGIYCFSWTKDGIRAEIAKAADVAPEDVKIMWFSGWSRTPQYREEW